MKKHYFLSLFVTLCTLQINAQTEAYFSQAVSFPKISVIYNYSL